MNSGLRRAAFGAAAMTAVAVAGSAEAMTLVVDPDAGCGKASCFGEAGTYTRTWSAKDFTGPVNVASLLMGRGVLGALDGETFRISFSLNGEELGTWGRYNMAGIGGETLSFSGQELIWNPADGDLTLTLSLDPKPKPGQVAAFGGFSSFDPGTTSSDKGPPPGPPPTALRETAHDAAPVPEPSAWALMIVGFGSAGATLRLQRRRPAPARLRR